jgi:hypothetical protein
MEDRIAEVITKKTLGKGGIVCQPEREDKVKKTMTMMTYSKFCPKKKKKDNRIK